MNRVIGIVLAAVLVVNAGGCATIVKGSHQDIGITSTPGGAYVKVDGIDKGTTPMVIKMKRSKTHTVQFDKAGYETFEAAIATKGSGWIWGNLLIGGVIGLIVDLISGASNNLEPCSVHAELTPANVQEDSQ